MKAGAIPLFLANDKKNRDGRVVGIDDIFTSLYKKQLPQVLCHFSPAEQVAFMHERLKKRQPIQDFIFFQKYFSA